MEIEIGSLIRTMRLDPSDAKHRQFNQWAPGNRHWNTQIWFGKGAHRQTSWCATHPRNEGTSEVVEVVDVMPNEGRTRYYVGAPKTETLYLACNAGATRGPYLIVAESLIEEVLPSLPWLGTGIVSLDDRDPGKLEELFLKDGVLRRFVIDEKAHLGCRFDPVPERLVPIGYFRTAFDIHWAYGHPYIVPSHAKMVAQVPHEVYETADAYVFDSFRARDGNQQVVSTFYQLAD